GGAVMGLVTGVVGTGLAVQPAIERGLLKLSEAQALEFETAAKTHFNLWASRAEWCDVAAELDFYALQSLAFLSQLESGDVFGLLPQVARGGPVGLAVQLVEADRICNPSGKPDTLDWTAGLGRDADGRTARVAIARAHPGTPGNVWDERAVWGEHTGLRQVLHVHDVLRPGQRRGMPYLAPVIEPLKQLGTYTDAEIMAAVVSGMFTVFITSEDADSAAAATAKPGAVDDIALEAGGVFQLGPNEKIETANPGRPNAAFDPFVQAIVRQIAMRLEQPYEVLLKHYTSSYTAARAAFLDAYRVWRRRRATLAAQFCQPVYEGVLYELVASGRLRAPGFLRDPLTRAAYCRADWIADAHGALNPVHEANAAALRIDTGMTTLEEETIAYSGRSWSDVHAQRVREVAARRAGGLQESLAAPAVTDPDKED
ncbi:MAG: phage portal protein, partial [Burkholderiaceae bacterium]